MDPSPKSPDLPERLRLAADQGRLDEALVAEYRAGAGMKELLEAAHISHKRLRRILVAQGVSIPRPGVLRPDRPKPQPVSEHTSRVLDELFGSRREPS